MNSPPQLELDYVALAWGSSLASSCHAEQVKSNTKSDNKAMPRDEKETSWANEKRRELTAKAMASSS